ncbi:formylglycine-generating enzyme family protein [Telluribacter sp.]|jgi:formylglycine-generating enzyme required for sulfatase activity|uniref:formylglycine-generating enzyme family protein n=1 Tax=Telluribacter sp. TaxID=1978767 RepID=UPI0039C8C3C8
MNFLIKSTLLLVTLAGVHFQCQRQQSDAEATTNSQENPISETGFKRTAGTADTSGMVFIPGGTFLMGADEFPDSRPVHQVAVDGFYMDEHEVTNAQFAEFVKATGYKTVAERPLNPADYPGVDPAMLVPGSAVFTPTLTKVSLENPLQWWRYEKGASWKQPEGPGSSIKGRENHPVVHVSYEDAAAYAKWAGKRLPTEAEWEYAARGGKGEHTYYWGDDLKPGNKWVANIYQGSFPNNNLKEDGYAGAAPVKSFPANPYGLYDMDGNVWEWCQDLYRPDTYTNSANKNPTGPTDSYDPDEPGVVKRVQRGGSFLCSDEFCIRYKAGSRGKGEVTSGSDNLGFRCVADRK